MWPIHLNTFLKQRKLCLKGEKTNYSYRRDPHLPPSASHPPFFSFPCFVEIQWLVESCCRMSTNILENEGFETQNFPPIGKGKIVFQTSKNASKTVRIFQGVTAPPKCSAEKGKKTPGTEAPNHSKSEIKDATDPTNIIMAQGGYPWVEGTSPSSSTQKGFWGGGNFCFPRGYFKSQACKNDNKVFEKIKL